MSDSGRVWGAGSDEEIEAVNARRRKAKMQKLVNQLELGMTIEIKPFEWNDFVDAYHEKFEKEKNVWRCVFTVGKIQITEINPD